MDIDQIGELVRGLGILGAAGIILIVGAFIVFRISRSTAQFVFSAIVLVGGLALFGYSLLHPFSLDRTREAQKRAVISDPCTEFPCIEIVDFDDSVSVLVNRGPSGSAKLDQVSGVKARSTSESKKIAALLVAAPNGIELKIYTAQPAATKSYLFELDSLEPTTATLQFLSHADKSKILLKLTLKTTSCEWILRMRFVAICASIANDPKWTSQPEGSYGIVPSTSVSGAYTYELDSTGNILDLVAWPGP